MRAIGYRKTATLSAGGVWPLNEQYSWKKDNLWPMLNDPYYSSVALLLPMTGTNNSTTFTDVSPSPKTVTRYGDAKISTAQSKWGSSGYFDGSGDYLTIPYDSSLEFETGNFTVEAWVRLADTSAYQFLIGTDTTGYFMLAFNYPVGTIGFGRHNIAWDGTFAGHGMANNTWYHVAITRSGTDCRCFVNGSQIDTTKTSSNNLLITTLYIAQHTNNHYLNGYIQDLRLTKGVARYTSDFTPPTAAFYAG